jgi:hypothetical protein
MKNVVWPREVGRGTTLGLLVVGAVTSMSAQVAKTTAPEPAAERSATPPEAPGLARQGMWLSAGLGAGAASLHCRICGGEQQTRGTTGYLRVGTTINPHFLLGAEMNGWMRSDQAGKQRVVALTGNAYWYPSPRHAYYLKGGFGLSRYRQWSQEEDGEVTTALSSGGFTGQVGVGYEVRVNPRMSIVPYFNLIGSARGSLSTESDDGTHFERDRLSTRANVLLLQLGLGVTWH